MAHISQLIDEYEPLNLAGNFAPSLRPYWLRSYIRAFEPLLTPLAILTDSPGPKLLVLNQTSPYEVESLCKDTADYCDFLPSGQLSEVEAASTLGELRAMGIRRVTMYRLPGESPTAEALIAAARSLKWSAEYSYSDTLPYISVAGMDDQGWAHSWGGAIREYARKNRRLHAGHEVEFLVPRTWPEVLWILDQARLAHIQRWAKSGIDSKWKLADRNDFINFVCFESFEFGVLDVTAMLIDRSFAAVRIGFRHQSRIYEWLTTYNLRFSHWSPGAVLLLHVLRTAAEQGIVAEYELLRGTEAWKWDWTDRFRRAHRLILVDERQ